MTQQKNFRDRLPFPAASIFIFVYITLDLMMRFFFQAFAGIRGGYLSLIPNTFTIIEYVLLLAIAILFLVKIPNVGSTITLALYLGLAVYSLVNTFNNYNLYRYAYHYNTDLAVFPLISSCLVVLAHIILAVQSISTYSKAKLSFFTAIWFLPALFQFTKTTLDFVYNATSRYFAPAHLYSLIMSILFGVVLLLIGKWMAEVSRIKHPDPNRPNAAPYNFRAPHPTFVQPPVPPMPQAPVVPPMPQAPVMPQAPFVPQPQKADPVQELTTYKEMLDNNLITQEEYDAKKKQLLGL